MCLDYVAMHKASTSMDLLPIPTVAILDMQLNVKDVMDVPRDGIVFVLVTAIIRSECAWS